MNEIENGREGRRWETGEEGWKGGGEKRGDGKEGRRGGAGRWEWREEERSGETLTTRMDEDERRHVSDTSSHAGLELYSSKPA